MCAVLADRQFLRKTEHLSIFAYKHVDNVKNVTIGFVLFQSSDITRPELDQRKQVAERLEKFFPTSSQEIPGCLLFELDGRRDEEFDKLKQETESLDKFSLATAFHMDHQKGKLERRYCVLQRKERTKIMDCTKEELLTDTWHYTTESEIKDHNFIKFMIIGESQTDVFLILEPADKDKCNMNHITYTTEELLTNTWHYTTVPEIKDQNSIEKNISTQKDKA